MSRLPSQPSPGAADAITTVALPTSERPESLKQALAVLLMAADKAQR
jgi:hypothetical protein